jgi:hypothetical protein
MIHCDWSSDVCSSDLIYVSGRYSLYSKEFNFSIIMNFDIDEYSDGIYEVNIITILPGKKGNNIVKFIDIL